MDSGGSSGTQTVKTDAAPWTEQKPYLQAGFNAAQSYLNSPGPSFYPFSTTAPISPETQSAWSAQTARGVNGSPVNKAAQGYNNDVLGGKYLNPGNPYLGGVDQAMWNQVQPRTSSMFATGGRYGPNAAFGDAVGHAYTDAIAPYHFQDYAAERSSQDAAAGRAPTLAATDYQDIAALGDVGAQRQGQAQTQIQGSMDRYNYDAQQPYNKLAQYMGLISGNYGGTSKSTQPISQPSTLQQILGGVTSAAGLGLGFMGG